MASSNASSICRIDWRPSRLLGACLIALGLLAAASLLLSDLDRRIAWPLALACVVTGWCNARCEARRLPVHILWPGGGEPALIATDQVRWELQAVSLHLRGPLAVLAGRDGQGCLHRYLFWPDTLDAVGRRALRLASHRRPAAPDTLAIALS